MRSEDLPRARWVGPFSTEGRFDSGLPDTLLSPHTGTRKDGAAAGGIPLPCPPGMILPGMKPRMLAARRWVEQPASKRGPAYWKGRALRKGRTRWQCGSQLRMTAGTDRPRGISATKEVPICGRW
nr:MAG TPA: hypothetical protein [Caudoviricetes sp.]